MRRAVRRRWARWRWIRGSWRARCCASWRTFPGWVWARSAPAWAWRCWPWGLPRRGACARRPGLGLQGVRLACRSGPRSPAKLARTLGLAGRGVRSSLSVGSLRPLPGHRGADGGHPRGEGGRASRADQHLPAHPERLGRAIGRSRRALRRRRLGDGACARLVEFWSSLADRSAVERRTRIDQRLGAPAAHDPWRGCPPCSPSIRGATQCLCALITHGNRCGTGGRLAWTPPVF